MSRRPPPDLKSQLGSLFRNTMQQLETVREVVVQRSKQGRAQLDVALLKRRRNQALADLGTVVLEMVQAGRLDMDDLPELGGPLAHVEELDERIREEELRARQAGDGSGWETAPRGYREEEYDEPDEGVVSAFPRDKAPPSDDDDSDDDEAETLASMADEDEPVPAEEKAPRSKKPRR